MSSGKWAYVLPPSGIGSSFADETGGRQPEIWALTRDDFLVDLQGRRIIHICKTLDRKAPKKLGEGNVDRHHAPGAS